MDCIVTFLLGMRKLFEAVKRLFGRSEVNYMQTNSIMDRRKVKEVKYNLMFWWGGVRVGFFESYMIKY